MKEPAAAIIVGKAARKIGISPKTVVIEDSSRIPGLTVPSGHLSSADVQVLSFGPGKHLSLGEGGAALFRLKSLCRKFIAATQHPERMAAQFSMSAAVPRLSLNGRIHPVAALLGHTLLTSS
jgi:dTDP-4-amino-4,6-dideoxygalactose transaminase